MEIAAGNGRNTRFLVLMGLKVTAVDCETPPEYFPRNAHFEAMDLEGPVWPLAGRTFDAVVGINYLYRPGWDALWENLAPGGLFLYETFTASQALRWGRPSNPAHWLKPGELLALSAGRGRLIAYEEGRTDADASFARIAVRKHGGGPTEDWLCVPR